MVEKSHKVHYAWLILLAAVAILGGVVGIFVNCTSILFSAIIQELGFRSGDLSIFYTIRALTQAATVGITTRLFFTKKPKVVMTCLAAIGAIAYIAMYFYSHLWQWYISGILVGISMSCVMVVIPVVLNNWFKVKNGLVIGIAMAASGLSGAVFSPILSKMILAVGWRKTAVFTGIIAFLIIVIPTVLILTITPEKKGMKPYGWELVQNNEAITAESKTESIKIPKDLAIVTTLSIVIASIMTQFGNQLPIFAQSLGYTISVGATVASLSMIGNVCGKLMIGAISDKIGIFKAVTLNSIIIAISMILLLFSGSSPIVMYLGALLMGLVFSMCTTVPPLIYIEVYGKDAYQTHLSRFQSYNSIVLALASSLLPYIYDFTGSFKGALILGFVLTITSLILFNIVKVKSNKLKNK